MIRQREDGRYEVASEKPGEGFTTVGYWELMPEHWYPGDRRVRLPKSPRGWTFEERFTLRLGHVSSFRQCMGIWDWRYGDWIIRPTGGTAEHDVIVYLAGMRRAWGLKR